LLLVKRIDDKQYALAALQLCPMLYSKGMYRNLVKKTIRVFLHEWLKRDPLKLRSNLDHRRIDVRGSTEWTSVSSRLHIMFPTIPYYA
jgi:hypothetical protein